MHIIECRQAIVQTSGRFSSLDALGAEQLLWYNLEEIVNKF